MTTPVSIDPERISPSRLWSGLDRGTRELAARAVYAAADRSQRHEADAAIAAALRFRDAAVRRMPVDRRVEYLVRVVRPDDALATTLLLALHLGERSGLLATFLDALEVPHEAGLIDADYELTAVPADRLRRAAEAIRATFPEDQVELYLASLLAMDPDVWGAAAEVLRDARSR